MIEQISVTLTEQKGSKGISRPESTEACRRANVRKEEAYTSIKSDEE